MPSDLAGRVADAFAERVRRREQLTLAPGAVRSYSTRGRLRPEEESSVRTPFQRDRDRIVHSKPFRRLKGKTQVFIDPGGDHYRTRMTHTLETTGIARVVARALGLNEDLTEAIGLGHDMGHPPFGHAGEEALDRALRERFDLGFRHNEQSLAIAEALNLTAEVRDGILTHRGEQLPETLEGRIVRIVDRVAYINHDIDDAIRHGILSPSDLPTAEIDLLGATGAARIDTLVLDLVETSAAAGDIAQSDEIGEAMLALRSFMFEQRLPGARRPRGAPARPRRRAAHLRPPRGAWRRAGGDRRLHLRHDRPFRAAVRRRAGLGRAPHQGRVGSRGRGRGRHGRGRLGPDGAQAGRRSLHRPVPVPRGADAELLRQRGRQALLLLRVRQGRRRDHLRPRDREPRFRRRGRVAGRALPHRARVRGVVAAAGGGAEAARPAPRCARPGRRVLRAAPLGDGCGCRGPRVPRVARPRRADRARVPARALAGAWTHGQGARGRVHDRRAPVGRPRERARERLLPVPVDVPARRRARADRRLPGAPAARGRPAARQVRQLAGEPALPQERDPVRAASRPDRDRQAGACRRGRGEHRRDRAQAGGVRAGGRVDGDGADRAAVEGARAPDAAALPLLRRRLGRRGRHAPRHGDARPPRASTSGS